MKKLPIGYKNLRTLLCWIPGKQRRQRIRANVCAKILKSRLPHILNLDETLDRLANGYSFARYGDGEFGYANGSAKTIMDFQRDDPVLRKRMAEILKHGSYGKLLIGIPALSSVYHTLYYYENYDKLAPMFNHDTTYGDSLISRVNENGMEFNLDKYKKIWDKRRVVFMYSAQGRFIEDPRLFDNIAMREFIDIPARHAHDEYDRIMADATKFDKDWLFLIAGGPTATVIAKDLYDLGYQAIDLGHLPNCMQTLLDGAPAPEATPSFRDS